MDRAVEDAAARDLEVREPGEVEHLGELEERRGRHGAGERLLAEDADRGVDEPWHDDGPYRAPAPEPLPVQRPCNWP